MQRRQFIYTAAAAAAASSFSGMSMAQDTSRPLRIVVPFPAGGPTDMVPRNMQDVLIKLLGGQAVVIENKAGAGGSIGMAEVARATDGVTFGIATLSTHGVNPAVFKKLPYDAINDFVGVTEIVKAPGVLVINPKLIPVKTFAEFVAYLKANPGKVSYATPATAPSAICGAPSSSRARAPKCTTSPTVARLLPSTTCWATRFPCTSTR